MDWAMRLSRAIGWVRFDQTPDFQSQTTIRIDNDVSFQPVYSIRKVLVVRRSVIRMREGRRKSKRLQCAGR